MQAFGGKQVKIYIAGKITNFPNYRQHFMAAERKLAEMGFSVMNPAWLGEYPGFGYEDYFDVAKSMLLCCDAIFLLENWEDSPGATKERAIAEKRGMRIFDSKKGAACWKELTEISLDEETKRDERAGKSLCETLRDWCKETLAQIHAAAKKPERDALQGTLNAYARVLDYLEGSE